MDRLKTLEAKVRMVLTNVPRTRDDDRELTLGIWQIFYGVNPYAPVQEVMRNKHLPSQESIGRCRRKIQETDESLRGTKAKEQVRMSEQEKYIEYAIEGR